MWIHGRGTKGQGLRSPQIEGFSKVKLSFLDFIISIISINTRKIISINISYDKMGFGRYLLTTNSISAGLTNNPPGSRF